MLAIEGVLVLIVTALLLILLVKEKASLDALGVGVLVALVAIGELLRLSDPSFDPALQLIDAAGALILLLPSMAVLAWYSWPSVRNSWSVMEGAISVGGIPASFLLKSLIPAFCVLLIVQGLACLLRDLARLAAPDTADKDETRA